MLPGCVTKLPIASPRGGTRCTASIPTVHTSAEAVIGLSMPKSANTAKAMPSTFVPWFWRTVDTSPSQMRPFQSRFAMICEIPLVIALRQCWGPALTATTMTTSISTVSSEMTEPVFANGMCASHRPRLKSRAGAFGWPPGRRHSLSPGRQRSRRSPRTPGQSDTITRQASCKAAP